jgi:glutamyl-tRNA reductase
MRLVLVGTSHRLAPVELRERMGFDSAVAKEVVQRLAGEEGEAVGLSTCNRVCLYVAHPDAAEARRQATEELRMLGGLALEEVESALYSVMDGEAARHLFRVAAGLDSLVPGEGEILGQVRAAYEAAREAGAVGPVLSRLFHQAIHTGRRVRTETALGENPASVSTAAAELAGRIFDDLPRRRILLVGAGKMGAHAAVDLVARGVKSLVVANRSLDRAERLATRFGARAVELDALEDELVEADIVIASTGSRGLVLSADQVERAIRRRGGRPVFFVDIAVPRDLDPAINELDGCYLYDIDDLERVVEGAAAGRREAASRAERIVSEEARAFAAWERSLDVVPAITSLHRRAEEIRSGELAKARGRLSGLSPRERRAVESLTTQIVSKLLHAPTVRLKEAAAAPEGAAYAETVYRLFDLGEQRPGPARKGGGEAGDP